MREAGKVSLPGINLERFQSIKEKHERMEKEIFWNEQEVKPGSIQGERTCLLGIIDFYAAALEETEQQNKRLETKLQASRDSVYPLSVERDEYKFELAEAQQTIANLESENKRLGSLLPVLKDATELMSWRDPGGGIGQIEALKLIYKWLEENPSPNYLADLRNKGKACCSNPNVQTVNNEFVINTTVCVSCGGLFREGETQP